MAKTQNGLPWSYDEMIVLHTMKKGGRTNREVAETLTKSLGKRDYTSNSVQKKYAETNWKKFFENEEDIRSEAAEETEADIEKQTIIDKTLENQERFLKREHARTQIIIDAIKTAIYRLPKPKMVDTRVPHKKKPYAPEHMGVMLSDIHVGASYTKADTGGLSEYNLGIFKSRMEKMKNAVVEIAQRHRIMYDIPHLHIFCLGDIVAGMREAGEWSSAYIDLEIYDQMMEGLVGLRDTIAYWARWFPKVSFYGVFGNHGRVGHRGVNKISTNWDRVVYSFLQQSLIDYKHISWDIATTWWIQKEIQNHSFYITHGDGIRGSMGIPYYGVERAERNINGIMPTRPDYMLLGHFHSPAEIATNSSRILMNGAFLGGDMYSLKDLFRSAKPEQKLFGIHEKKGVTWTYNLHLDEAE